MLLVTGGAGFIGAAVVHAARQRGEAVRVLDDLSTGDAARLPAGVDLVVGDVADPAVVAMATEDVTAVVHLAAHRAVRRSVATPLDTDRANTHGTLCVLEAARARNMHRVVVASSSSVYGDAAPLPTPETASMMPASPYAVSKLAAEHYTRLAHELHGMSTIALRFFNVYGPGQSPHGPYAQLVPRVIEAARTGGEVLVFGDGTQSRDLVFVDDIVAAVLAALDSTETGALNVGSGTSTTVNAVIAAVSASTGADFTVRHLRPRIGDVRHTRADVTRAADVLGWTARTSLADGVDRCYAVSRSPRSSRRRRMASDDRSNKQAMARMSSARTVSMRPLKS